MTERPNIIGQLIHGLSAELGGELAKLFSSGKQCDHHQLRLEPHTHQCERPAGHHGSHAADVTYTWNSPGSSKRTS